MLSRSCTTSLTPSQRVSQLSELQDQIRTSERRLTEIDRELAALRANQIDESEVTRLLAEFHQTWEALAPRDQARVIELLIERIDYRGQDGQISLTFRPSGIQTLTQETVDWTPPSPSPASSTPPAAATDNNTSAPALFLKPRMAESPRLSRLMALAIHCEELLRSGNNYQSI